NATGNWIKVVQRLPVRVELDARQLEQHPLRIGLSGTGSAFSLLPAQNATGNWIKVVQRLPVRVELDARQLEQHPLRIG
ncbi:multidrug export protein EmrA, partial [Salmonella enterica]